MSLTRLSSWNFWSKSPNLDPHQYTGKVIQKWAVIANDENAPFSAILGSIFRERPSLPD